MRTSRITMGRSVAGATLAALLSGASGLAQDAITVTPYGRVKADASYDSTRVSPGDWVAWAVPRSAGTDDNEFNFTARDSRFGLRVLAPDYEGIKTAGLVELDFLSSGPANSPNPRLRLAYLDFSGVGGWSVRIGQDWDLFGIYHPNSVDPGLLGNTGNPRGFRPQVQATHSMKLAADSRLAATVALTRNIGGQDLDGGGQDDGDDAGLPGAQVRLALHAKGAADRPLTIALSGLLGRETVDQVERTIVTSPQGVVTESVRVTGVDKKDYDVWLAHVAAVLPISGRIGLQGVAWTGQNLNAYQGGIGQGVNGAAGKAIRAQGGYAQLTAQATERLTLGVGYGVDDPKDGDLGANGRTRNSRLYGNAVYAVTPAAAVGLEVSRIETEYKDAETVDATRVAFSSQFRF